MNYLVGDIQGCCSALQRLLARIDFSPSRDHLYALGDLVNRGPSSLDTLQTLRGLQGSATCLLGNHDLHLLATAHGIRPTHRSDTLHNILESPQRDACLEWLRQQRMAVFEQGWLMVHAGVAPQWTLALTLELAAAIEQQLRSNQLREFLEVMYGNQPNQWSDELSGFERLRFAINALTRIRFVQPDGTLDFKTKKKPVATPDIPNETTALLAPWFEAPHRNTQDTPIAFGHWSTLGLINQPHLLAIDTGCVWGGSLTAIRLEGNTREVIQVQCDTAQKPTGNE